MANQVRLTVYVDSKTHTNTKVFAAKASKKYVMGS